ncbi:MULTISPECIES: stage V sporulation protein AA [Paenibacillus]|uniref:stage V sporulation protein AA n=1 Tax=Paenibacillus TaxID=44249 RepID=UPI00203C62E2|nr:stage V sporulation protein AA [Paenibacillus camelliae]MCM3633120.1 stage V sporulation protein AA [Paenibacillus camelliae]
MANSSASIYLRLKKRISISKKQIVKLKDAAHVLADDKSIEQQLKDMILYRHKEQDGNRVVIDLLQIIALLKQKWPDLQIDVYGDPQILVMVSERGRKPHYVVLVVSWLLLFCGSGLALMNFHSDVNMKETHIRIVELITGQRVERPLWFQIPYSIGVGAGMVLFFNHIFKKKFNEEPNPLEVEMFMYQENVNTYVIAEEIRNRGKREAQKLGEEGYD